MRGVSGVAVSPSVCVVRRHASSARLIPAERRARERATSTAAQTASATSRPVSTDSGGRARRAGSSMNGSVGSTRANVRDRLRADGTAGTTMPPASRNSEEQPVGRGEVRLRPQPSGEHEPDRREATVPSRIASDRGGPSRRLGRQPSASPTATTAITCSRTTNSSAMSFAASRPRASERRDPEPAQDAGLPLEPRRDRQARHRARDDGEPEHAGHEEVDRAPVVRQHVGDREEREDADGDPDRDEQALAAPQREDDLHPGLRPDAAHQRVSSR